MGYTHYFSIASDEALSTEGWDALRADFTKLLANLPEQAASEDGFYLYEKNSLKVRTLNPDDTNAIHFNGEGDLGHEDFFLNGVRDTPTPPFDFCKTARKPYDLLVCATLILCEHHLPGWRLITSDGDPEDWLPALFFARSTTHLGQSLQLPYSLFRVADISTDFVIGQISRFITAAIGCGFNRNGAIDSARSRLKWEHGLTIAEEHEAMFLTLAHAAFTENEDHV